MPRCAVAVALLLLLGACTSDSEPAGLPESTSPYQFDDARVERLGSGDWSLLADVTWEGEGDPERKGCNYSLRDADGRTLATGTFTLSLQGDSLQDVPLIQIDSTELETQPGAIDVRCLD